MAGICGIIQEAGNPVLAVRIEEMTARMAHPPNSVSGTHSFTGGGGAVGWAAQPGSLGASMPFMPTGEECVIFLTGEVHFDEPATAPAKLRRIVQLYRQHGPEFVRRLNGTFAGVIADGRERRTLLFNDRYGMARIYIHEEGRSVYFASEAKSLLWALPHLRTLDTRSLGELLACGCVMEGRTLFPGLSLLPPGSLWSIALGEDWKRSRYFTEEQWESQEPLGPDEYYDGLKGCFRRVVPRYLAGDPPPAISLTGGVDSRLIMAWRPAAATRSTCFSFGGPFRECYDVRIGRQVARACGHEHRVIQVGDPFLSRFPDLAAKAAFVSDGTMDASGAVELYANEQARKLAPVRVTGNYGGEILRSMVSFRPARLNPQPFAPELLGSFASAERTFASHTGGQKLSFIAFKQVPWYHYARLSVEQSQVVVRSPFLDNDLVAHVFRAPPSLATSKEIALRLIADGNPALAAIPTDRGLRLGKGGLRQRADQLWRAFLTRAEYAYDYGMPQPLVRADRVLEPMHLERLFLGWNKFYHLRYWYRHQLSDYLRDTLLARRTLERPYLSAEGVRRIVTDHTEGRANHTVEISRLLGLELAHRELLDSGGWIAPAPKREVETVS